MDEPTKLPGYSLRQLHYFIAVAEEGTVSGAAERLRVSASALSLALTELERALRVQLCIRRKAHGVTLTASGAQLLRHARALLRQAHELETDIANPEGELSGLLSVGCFQGLAPVMLPRLLQGFGERHPRVTIDFEEGDQNRLQQRLLDGKLDLVVVYDVALQPTIQGIELSRMRPHIMLPATHRLADQPRVALHDLADEPMVLLQEPPSADHGLGLCHQAGIAPIVRYRARNGETARALVGRGLGWAVIVSRRPDSRTYEGLTVVHREIAELPDVVVSVVIAWPRDTRLSRRAEEFVRYSVELASDFVRPLQEVVGPDHRAPHVGDR